MAKAAKPNAERHPAREKMKKPQEVRVLELMESLRLIVDSLEALDHGEHRYLMVLSGQLRSLLTERNHTPLLFSLAKEFGYDLNVKVMPTAESLVQDRKPGDFHMAYVPIFPLDGKCKTDDVTLAEFLDRKHFAFNGDFFTPRDIITWYANQWGGSHYSPETYAGFAALGADSMRGENVLAHYLRQIGKLTLQEGVKLLRWHVEHELQLVLVLPKQSALGTNYLLDAIHESGRMRSSVGLKGDDFQPFFSVSGVNGEVAEVVASAAVDWSRPRHLRAALKINDDMTCALELWLDDQRVGQALIDRTLYVRSALNTQYEVWLNRAFNGQAQNLRFGCYGPWTFENYSDERWKSDAAGRLAFFADPARTFHVIASGTRGVRRKGNNQFDMSVPPARQTAAELLL